MAYTAAGWPSELDAYFVALQASHYASAELLTAAVEAAGVLMNAAHPELDLRTVTADEEWVIVRTVVVATEAGLATLTITAEQDCCRIKRTIWTPA